MPLNIIALVFFGISWGTTIPLLKHATTVEHHPLGMMLWQLGVSIVFLLALALFNRQPWNIKARHLKFLLIIAFLGTLLPNSFSLLAIRELPAGIMAIVIAMVPILSLLIALMYRIEKFSWIRLAGIIIGVVALLMMALPDSTLPDPSKAPWILVALIAPLCYAIEGNFVAVRTPSELSATTTLLGASILGLLILAPVVYLANWQVPVLVKWDSTRWAIVLAAIGHVVSYTGYLWLLGRAGAVFTSQVAYVVTLTGVLSGVIFLGERYGILLWVSFFMMLLAVTLVRPLKSSP